MGEFAEFAELATCHGKAKHRHLKPGPAFNRHLTEQHKHKSSPQVDDWL